jgi:regulator of replication initiation timing
LLRQQLVDAQVEVDTIYEAFNTELDGLFADAQLPEAEAWESLQDNLKSSMNERNSLRLENERLRRELQQARLQ